MKRVSSITSLSLGRLLQVSPPSRAGTDIDDGSHIVEAAELHSLPASHLHSSQQDGEEEQSESGALHAAREHENRCSQQHPVNV